MSYISLEEARAERYQEQTENDLNELVLYARDLIESHATALNVLNGYSFEDLDSEDEASKYWVLRYASQAWSLGIVLFDLILSAYYNEAACLYRFLAEFQIKSCFYSEFPNEAIAYNRRNFRREESVQQMANRLWGEEHAYGKTHDYAHASRRMRMFHITGFSEEGLVIYSPRPDYYLVFSKMFLVELIRSLLHILTCLSDTFSEERRGNVNWEQSYIEVADPNRSDPIWEIEYTQEEIDLISRLMQNNT